VASNNFWLNYKNGVSYPVIVQTPQYRASSMEQLNRTPINRSRTAAAAAPEQPGLGQQDHDAIAAQAHYNVQPVFDVYANVQGTDLGSVSSQVSRIVAKYQGQLSKASSIVVGDRCRA